MSNSYAISAVTATLSYLLNRADITVDTKPPDAQTTGNSRINIFLYHIMQNLGYKNRDQPARSYTGDLVKNQQIGLDLYYLLTAYGDNDDDLLAQKTLAEAVRVLHERPVLTRGLIDEAMSDPDIKAKIPSAEKVDLSKQLELVKVTMHDLSLEDLTKIWSSFFKTGSYRISVAYKATVVLLDGKLDARAAMPVRERNIYAMTPKQPEITYVEPQMVEWSSSGMEMIIHGKSLKTDEIKIDFGQGLEVKDMITPKFSTDERLIVNIPHTFAAGIKQVKVIHPISIGTPNTLHKGPESNVVLFAVVPKILDIQPSLITRKLTVTFNPKITREQEVRVIIGTYRPLAVTWVGDAAETETVEVDIPTDFKKGEYPVRIRVDGAESQPDESIKNEYKRKTVNIP